MNGIDASDEVYCSSDDNEKDTCLLCLSSKGPLIHSSLCFDQRQCECSFYLHLTCLTSTYAARPEFGNRCLHCNKDHVPHLMSRPSPTQVQLISDMYRLRPPPPYICMSPGKVLTFTITTAILAFFIYLLFLSGSRSNIQTNGRLLRS